jgi:hypothetical protein
MSVTKRISAIGVLVAVAIAAVLVGGCLGRRVASRVPIPGSSMTAVVTEDIAGTYSCRLFDGGHPISDFQMLGPAATEHCSLAQVSTASNIITITWTDGGSNGYHYSTAVDVDARRFVVYSNGVPVR